MHVGSPDSPVAYYQQVGRAGRALAEAVGVLLPAAESDPRIWDWFATATIPDPDAARRVLALLPDRDGRRPRCRRSRPRPGCAAAGWTRC